jgi:hypothetical protein
VVGAAAEAGIIGGYPDGSFGPKRPTTRAEAVAILDRALPAPVGTEETTTTTTGSSSDGSSEPTGVSVRLSGIEISGGGTLTPNFSPDTRTYTYETSADTVNVKGIPQSTSFTLQYSINGGSYSTAVSSANNNGVSNVAVPGEVKIRVNRSGSNREYTVTLTKESPQPTPPPSGGLPEGIRDIEVADPYYETVAQAWITDVKIFIESGYEDKIDFISFPTLTTRRAIKQPDGTYYIGFTGTDPAGYSRTQIIAAMHVEYLTNVGQEEEDIAPPAGSWPEPIERITKMDESETVGDVDITGIRIYIKADAVLSALDSITVNGKSVTYKINDRLWWVGFDNVKAEDFGIPAVNVVYNYTPQQPSTDDLISSRTRVAYTELESGYVAFIVVKSSMANAITNIEIRDKATGVLLAELAPQGTIERNGTTNQFTGLVESRSSSEPEINRTVIITARAGEIEGEAPFEATYIQG